VKKRAGRARKARRAGKAGRPGKAGQPFIILTGLSGSGKSQAIRALEDLGYFCVDNLPTTLIPTMAKLSLQAGGDIDKVAIVVDVREGNLLSSLPKMLARLRRMPRLNPVLIFLEASHEALVRRFSETRRPHPLAPDRSVTEGIRDEHARMRPIRELADEIVDTSDMTVHELRQFFMALSRDRSRAKLVMTVVSFGYKFGLPVDVSALSAGTLAEKMKIDKKVAAGRIRLVLLKAIGKSVVTGDYADAALHATLRARCG